MDEFYLQISAYLSSGCFKTRLNNYYYYLTGVTVDAINQRDHHRQRYRWNGHSGGAPPGLEPGKPSCPSNAPTTHLPPPNMLHNFGINVVAAVGFRLLTQRLVLRFWIRPTFMPIKTHPSDVPPHPPNASDASLPSDSSALGEVYTRWRCLPLCDIMPDVWMK